MFVVWGIWDVKIWTNYELSIICSWIFYVLLIGLDIIFIEFPLTFIIRKWLFTVWMSIIFTILSILTHKIYIYRLMIIFLFNKICKFGEFFGIHSIFHGFYPLSAQLSLDQIRSAQISSAQIRSDPLRSAQLSSAQQTEVFSLIMVLLRALAQNFKSEID